jgi:hypothetical protein
MNYVNFNDILSYEEIPLQEFLNIQEWITQRNTEKRASKSTVKSNLSTLRPSHVNVAIGHLTENDESEDGTFYSAGSKFILDGNTRKLFWQRSWTDYLPEFVYAVVYSESNLLSLRKHYYSYDSPDATEQAAEVMTGIFKLLDFKPKSKKIAGGSIVTAQNFASVYTKGAPLYDTHSGIWGIVPSENETKTSAKRWAMAEQFKFWQAEWRWLDNIGISGKSIIDQPLIMAFLIAAKAFPNNPTLEDLVNKLNIKDYNASKGTPISKIAEAATSSTKDVHIKNGSSYDIYLRAFNFYLYWINRQIENPNQIKCKGKQGGYDGYGAEFVEKYISNANVNLNKLLICP